jgi:hypothetical protein
MDSESKLLRLGTSLSGSSGIVRCGTKTSTGWTTTFRNYKQRRRSLFQKRAQRCLWGTITQRLRD